MLKALAATSIPKPLLSATDSNSLHASRNFWSATFVTAAAFLVIEPGVFGQSANQFHELFQAGVLSRNLAYLAFGLFGCRLWRHSSGTPAQGSSPILRMMIVYGALCFFSVAWTDSVETTFPKLMQLACFGAGVIGLARCFTVRDLAKLALVVMALNLTVAVIVEVATGRFHPELSNYRFAGMTHPHTQGIQCGLLALSALALLRHTRRNVPLHIGLIAVGLLFLLLTKSQISCAAFFAAVVVEVVMGSRSPRKWPIAAVGALLVVAIVLTDTVEGSLAVAATNPLIDSVSRFQRGTLRNDVLHTLVGFGYGGFWSINRAHNGFMVLLVNVGILGSVPFIWMVISGLKQAWKRYRLTANEEYRFLVAQIVLGLVTSLAGVYYTEPSLYSAICAATLASMAFKE
jgi:hypothetical protein